MLKSLIYKSGTQIFFIFGEAMQFIQATSQNFFLSGTCSQKNATANFFLGLNRDHLGNVRLSYADTDNSGDITQNEIIEEKAYYPFGMTLKGINDVTTANGNSLAQRYMYNQGTSGKDFQGKEGKSFKVERQFDLSLNVDMTKFRMYDYALGRFTSIDPLADANPQESLTPYQYAYNNPVLYNDPYGDCPKCWDFVVNVFKSTTVKSVSISLGVGAKVSNTGAVASVSEFKYDLKSNKFSYSAGEGFIGVGDSQDAIKGQVKIGYSSKNFDNDKTEGGFIKLEGSAINEGNEKGGSVSIFAKNEKGEKGAVLIENEDAEVDASEVSSPSNDTSGKFKFGFGISFSFDWVKFEELQNESKQKRDFPERE